MSDISIRDSIDAPTEGDILRVAMLLSMNVLEADIRQRLLSEGKSPEYVFLAVCAGKTYNTIGERTYTEEGA